jgi:hypothetical protein
MVTDHKLYNPVMFLLNGGVEDGSIQVQQLQWQ